MPTKHPRKSIIFTEEQVNQLDALRVELQKAGRRGTALYVPLRTSLTQFIAKLALERAAQIEEELRRAEHAAARRRPMKPR